MERTDDWGITISRERIIRGWMDGYGFLCEEKSGIRIRRTNRANSCDRTRRSGMKRRAVAAPLAIANVRVCTNCSKKNSTFLIRDDQSKKGDPDDRGSKKLCIKKPLMMMDDDGDVEDENEDIDEDKDKDGGEDYDYDNNVGADVAADDDDDVSSNRVKSLTELLKKHNVYFGKFIISRK